MLNKKAVNTLLGPSSKFFLGILLAGKFGQKFHFDYQKLMLVDPVVLDTFLASFREKVDSGFNANAVLNELILDHFKEAMKKHATN